MKKILNVLILVLICYTSFSQDTTKKFLKGLYLSAGAMPFKFENLPKGYNISIISELDDYFIVGFRYYHAGYKDKEYPTPKGGICFGCPIHVINEFNLSLGKSIVLNKYFSLSITTGPSYIKYLKPGNITPKSQGGFFNLGLGYYDFDEVRYRLFGWSSRVDLNILPLKFLGVSVGGFYNYNKMQSLGGVSINILVGRIRYNPLSKHI